MDDITVLKIMAIALFFCGGIMMRIINRLSERLDALQGLLFFFLSRIGQKSTDREA